MVSPLGRIVDDLYDNVRSGKKVTKQIVFVVGNGIHPVNNILNDTELRKKVPPGMSASDFEAFKWRHFEFARYWTSNALPSFAHFCIRQLLIDGLSKDVITTNYDLFFDVLWERTPSLIVVQNPVRDASEYDWEGYYAIRSHHNRRRRYWKIHGSLSHVCFQQKVPPHLHHIHRLPRFAISVNNEDLATAYRIPSQAPILNYEMSIHARTPIAPPDEISGPFQPFIDWTYSNNRTRFLREIQSASDVLKDQRRLAAVVLLGFSGYFNDIDSTDPWNEELVPVIRALGVSGFDNIYMAVHRNQFVRRSRPNYALMRDLEAAGRCLSYDKAADFMVELFSRNSFRFPYRFVDNEYGLSSDWYLSGAEPKHS